MQGILDVPVYGRIATMELLRPKVLCRCMLFPTAPHTSFPLMS